MLARRPAIVDHSVGQKRIVAGDLLDPDIPLPGVRVGSQQYPVDLMPAPRRNRLGHHPLGQHSRRPVVDVQLKDAGAPIHLSRVDQRHVAAVLLVLLQGIDPGPIIEGRPVGHGVVEDAVLAAASGRSGPRSNHHPAHVATGLRGEHRPGQGPASRSNAVHFLAAKVLHDLGDDRLFPSFKSQREEGGATAVLDGIGHEAEFELLGRRREIGHDQFTAEVGVFDDDG